MTAIVSTFILLLVLRMTLAGLTVARYRRYQGSATRAYHDAVPPIVVLQPILSGDPDLGRCLRANLAAAEQAANTTFVWLVDEDDAEGLATAQREATGRVRVLTGPPPAQGENPKLVKLERGLAIVDPDAVVVVLDDDTMVSGRALGDLTAGLAIADLVTGLPVWTADRTIYERLIGGFVNGHAMLTYWSAAAIGAQRTINGMAYAARAVTLRGLGGFAAVSGSLTDDYAVARLFDRNGRVMRQMPVCVSVTMTVSDARHCARVLRRWLIFANLYLRDHLDAKTGVLVLLPSTLSIAGLAVGLAGGVGSLSTWMGCLALKAAANRWMVWRWGGDVDLPVGPIAALQAMGAEMLADLLLPLAYVSALVRPRRLSWRSRRIDLSTGRIRYE